MNLQEKIDNTEEYGTLVLEFNEYVGQVVIDKPITIDGQNSTVCTKRGPVLSVHSEGVSLKNLRLEVTSDAEGGESDLALMIKEGISADLEKIKVRGNVSGIVNEDGVWNYPDVLHIWPIVPQKKNYFTFDMDIPISCVLETDIADLKIVNPGLNNPGSNRIFLEVGALKKKTVLFGQMSIKSNYLRRIISISGSTFGVPEHVSEPDKNNPVLLPLDPESVSEQSKDRSKKAEGQGKDQKETKDRSKIFKWGFAAILLLSIIGLAFLFFHYGKDAIWSSGSDNPETGVQKDKHKPASAELAETNNSTSKIAVWEPENNTISDDDAESETVRTSKDTAEPAESIRKQPSKDIGKPTGKITGIGSRYTVGDTISYALRAEDDKSVSKMTFEVHNSPERKVWIIRNPSAAKSDSFSTSGWNPGAYRYSLIIEDEADNFKRCVGRFVLAKGKDQSVPEKKLEIIPEQEPADSPDIMDVTTTPSGAIVRLNKGAFSDKMSLDGLLSEGEFKGETPLQLELEPGIHELTLKKDGYYDLVVEVEMEPDAGTIPLEVELVRSD